MYDYIKGQLTHKSNTTKGFFVSLETSNGVGYLIEITSQDYEQISVSEDILKLYTVLIHREDKMGLCGFIKRDVRDIFNILISVSGVGAKMALTLLDEFNSSELIGFVIDGNYKAITRAKGVGPKLAQKIILELKDKLKTEEAISKVDSKVKVAIKQDNNSEEAIAALQVLGYNKKEVEKILEKFETASLSVEDIIKKALVYLAK